MTVMAYVPDTPPPTRWEFRMDRDALEAPRILLYHDITLGGRVSPREAARRLRSHLEHLAMAGYRFASVDDLLRGHLGPHDAVVTFDDASRSFADIALPMLGALGAPVAVFALSGLAGRADAAAVSMSWRELRECSARGVHVGCHAATHVPLDEVPAERMRAEITSATRRFEEEGLNPTTFAYPFGRYDDAVKAAVRDAGYSAAFTVMRGGADVFEIRRRLLSGGEGPLQLGFELSDRFFETRDAVRRFVPRRFLLQERPIARGRWGAGGFGLSPDPAEGATDAGEGR